MGLKVQIPISSRTTFLPWLRHILLSWALEYVVISNIYFTIQFSLLHTWRNTEINRRKNTGYIRRPYVKPRVNIVLLCSFLWGIHNFKTFDTFHSRPAKAPIHNESAGAGAWSDAGYIPTALSCRRRSLHCECVLVIIKSCDFAVFEPVPDRFHIHPCALSESPAPSLRLPASTPAIAPFIVATLGWTLLTTLR